MIEQKVMNHKTITFNRLKEEPKMYFKHRFLAFLAAHGKFGFDYIYPVPNGWKNFYSDVYKIYENKNAKLIRQILLFIFKMYVYFIIIKFFFSKKVDIKFRSNTFFSSLIYIYLLCMSVFVAGTEQERILYTGFIINLFFIICFLKRKNFT